MKAKRVIIGSLLLLLLMSGTYVWRRGGDFSTLSSAYTTGGGGSGGGIRQIASSLWMTMVNTELGIPPGQSPSATAGDRDDASLNGLDPASGPLDDDASGTGIGLGDETPAPAPMPGAAPVPGSTHGQASSFSIGPGRIIGWFLGDDKKADETPTPGPAPAPMPGAAPVPGSTHGQASSFSIGPGRIIGWFRDRMSSNRNDGSSGEMSDETPAPAPMPGAAPVPSSTQGQASSFSIGPGRIIGWLFGDSKKNERAGDSDGAPGTTESATGQVASANDPSFEPGDTFNEAGATAGGPGDLSGTGTPAMGGPGEPSAAQNEIAQADGAAGNRNEIAMGQQGGTVNRRIPRAADFGARLRDRENIIERHTGPMADVGFPVTVKDVRATDFRGFLGRTRRAHANWYRRRADLIGEYNRARARDRAAISQSFRAAQARDRRDGGQAHLRKFMNDSRAFNARRAAQNTRFQAMLDRTGARIGRRFQYLFHLSLRRHIARQERKSPDQDEWRRLKGEAFAVMGRIYGDGRVPAASRGVNRGVRNYMRHWIAFFYDKKIRGAARPEAPRPEPVIEREEVVQKFQPKENCGPTNLNTYSLGRMRKFVKSLESNCPAANGLPDLLLKECHPYHVQIDLKVSCKRDIYYFLKFDSENTYDRNQAIDHFKDGCRPYRSVGDLAQTYTNDPNRGIDSLQKDKMNRMLNTMRSCSPGSVSPPPVRPAAPKPKPDPGPSLRPGNAAAPETREEPGANEIVPENMPAKEPEAGPEPESASDPAGESEPEADEPSAEETLGFPEE